MKWAYYNEFDQQKAAWLRELMRAGLIAEGEVDERPIQSVRADDLRGFQQCHFFAGIGVWSYALRLAGWPDDREAWTGSCPCTPFSAAGKRQAKDDERHLWPEFFRLIEARRPVVAFGEQVSSIDGLAWLDDVQADLDGAGYTVGALDLCSPSVGAPNIRQRLYFAAGLAEPEYGGFQTGEPEWRGTGAVVSCRTPFRLEYPESDGWEQRGTESSGRRVTGGCGASGVGDSDGERQPFGRERNQQPIESGEPASRGLDVGRSSGVARLGDSEGVGWRRGPDDDNRGRRERSPSNPGPVNGFWAGSDWVLTRPQRVGDPPSLRPVAPGTFPLASGVAHRILGLRGAGDAINAQVAAAFIRAWLEETERG